MHSYFKYINIAKAEEKIRTMSFPFSRNLFWDVDIENIDLQKHSRYVIERVVTRGFTEDFYILLKIYSTHQIQEALRKSKELDAKTANFCSYFFKIPKSEVHVSSFYR
jgi:hypothetical protein